jgi:hypothetical protein
MCTSGCETALLVTGCFALFSLASIILLAWYIITGNEKPFLRFYAFILCVDFPEELN